jgi:hypothetical protein
MGHARRLAERVNLTALVPHPELASTGYCLADPARDFVVYVSRGDEAIVNLATVSGTLAVEWIHAADGTTRRDASVTGGGKRPFKAPFDSDAVLYLHP